MIYVNRGVFGISKVQIQKQITTWLWRWREARRCIWYFKGTNSKANHNLPLMYIILVFGVFGISKVQIQKQITTSDDL